MKASQLWYGCFPSLMNCCWIGINSKNVLYAATTAHAKGMKVIGLTGAKDSKLKDMSDVCIKAPQTETYMIQELHLPIYHCLSLMLEARFFA